MPRISWKKLPNYKKSSPSLNNYTLIYTSTRVCGPPCYLKLVSILDLWVTFDFALVPNVSTNLTNLFDTVFEEDGEDKKIDLKEATTIRNVHEESQQMLNTYVNYRYPLQPFRLGKLYLTMTSSKNISSKVIEDLFFRRTIGPVPISRIICGMYKSNFL